MNLESFKNVISVPYSSQQSYKIEQEPQIWFYQILFNSSLMSYEPISQIGNFYAFNQRVNYGDPIDYFISRQIYSLEWTLGRSDKSVVTLLETTYQDVIKMIEESIPFAMNLLQRTNAYLLF